MFPASEKEWFLADMDVQETFETDSEGNATQVTARQNGRQMLLGKRIDDTEASRITTELATRVKNQTPQTGVEAVLRRDIDEMLHGTPQYEHMSAGLAGAVRQQLPQLQAMFGGLGPLQSISFRRVEPDGSNVYDIKFANGNTEWHVLLGPDGKVEGEGFRPIP
jgi:ribosomal protein S30